MKTIRWIVILAIAMLSALPSPATQKPGKKPAPEFAEFLSQVRYLISKEERKAFLSLPDEQKPGFIEHFWKTRDTDPATPTNEFKDDYLARIRQANELFTGEVEQGWLSDRGRIYVLYGPPSRRETAAPAGGKTGACLETWYYGDFSVVFSDRNCRGAFVLTTRDLSRIDNLDISRSSAARSLQEPKRLPFDFEVRILKKPIQGEMLEGLVRLEMPYGDIWFAVNDGVFQTSFGVELVLEDGQRVARWQFKRSFPLSLTAAELKEKQKEKFRIEVPMTIEKDAAGLRAGRCRLTIIMENETSKERIRKVAEFSF